MVEKKINVGDKVRIKGDWTDGTSHLDGKIGEVLAVNTADIEVRVKGEPFTWMIWNHNYKPVVEETEEVIVDGFKVGDRVNVDGMNGTIICITKGDLFGVQFDDENYKGHRCMSVALKAGKPSLKENCWWVSSKSLEHGEAAKDNPTEYYNGRVVCVCDDYDWWTLGKVYTVVDGTLIDDDGELRYKGDPIKDIRNRREMFIPLIDGKNDPLSIEELLKMDGEKVWLVSLDEHKKPQKNGWYGGWHRVDVEHGSLIDDRGEFYEIADNNSEFGYLAYRTPPVK